MARENYDFSEYKPTEYEKYQHARSDKRNISFSYFHNEVQFNGGTDMMIEVDYDKEDFEMHDLLEAAKDYAKKPYIESEIERKARLEELEEEKLLIEKMTKKYGLERMDIESEIQRFYDDHPEELRGPLNNIYSGGNIDLKVGEGILDFIYADFLTPLKQNIAFFGALETFAREARDKERPELSEIPKDKISNIDQLILEDYYNYSLYFHLVRDVAYASLYSAICPPLISKVSESIVSLLKKYANYLLTLQKEYLEIIEFCFDDEFYPDLFSELTPGERYALYRHIHGLPSHMDRKEVLRISNHMSGKAKPYGMEINSFIKKLTSNLDRDPAIYKDFAEKYGTTADDVKDYLTMPRFLSTYYNFSSVADILELELSKMLESNIRFRKCKRCGKYFIMKGNYNTNYCDRISEGQTRTCQELAAIDNYKQKTADNEAIKLYTKYYKRYHARVKVRQIKENDFNHWKLEAMTRRDQCIDGKMDIGEFEKWMEESFPNRKTT